MKFSICVPVYQVEQYLPECITSIQSQTYQDYEVILVDDGSVDQSGKICDTYAALDDRVQVIHKKNEGLLLARRTAISIAKGEYIIFVDSDDVMEENQLFELDKIIKKTHADVILFNAYVYCNKKKTPFFENLYEERLYKGLETERFLCRMAQDFAINAMWLKAVRSEIIDKENSYLEFRNVSNGEDLLQSIAIYERANTIYYLNKFLYNYRVNPESMTRKYSPNYFLSFKSAFQVLTSSLNKKKLYNEEKKAQILFINRVFEDVIQSCGKNSPLSCTQKIGHLREIQHEDFYCKVYQSAKHYNPLKRSKCGLWLLSKKKYLTVIIYVYLWQTFCCK